MSIDIFRQLTATLSLVELFWISSAALGLLILGPLAWGWWGDRAFASERKQAARKRSATILLGIALFVGSVLVCFGVAGLISATLPPNGGTVSPQAAAIALLIVAGEMFLVAMVLWLAHAYYDLVGLMVDRWRGRVKDQGR